MRGESTGEIWEDRLIDLRVDDHAEPVKEIRRLLRVFRAYEHMNAGDEAMEHRDVEGALAAYGAAQAMFPDNLEMRYWHAIALANLGRLDEALPIFQPVFDQDPNWRAMTERLSGVGLLNVGEADLAAILTQG